MLVREKASTRTFLRGAELHLDMHVFHDALKHANFFVPLLSPSSSGFFPQSNRLRSVLCWQLAPPDLYVPFI
jgi:hypothetical protein